MSLYSVTSAEKKKKVWFSNLDEDLEIMSLNIEKVCRLAVFDQIGWRDSVIGCQARSIVHHFDAEP